MTLQIGQEEDVCCVRVCVRVKEVWRVSVIAHEVT